MYSRSYPESFTLSKSLLFAATCLAAACASEQGSESVTFGLPGDSNETLARTGEDADGIESIGAAGSGQTSGWEADVAADDEALCTDPQQVRFSRIKPRLTLVIDGSESMREPFLGATSRWSALRAALLDEDDGLIAALQGVIHFGIVLFSNGGESSVVADTGFSASAEDRPCPDLVAVKPLLNNLEAIEDAFPQDPPGGWSPTAAALELASDQLMQYETEEQKEEAPSYLVLCTDGKPTACLDPEDSGVNVPPEDWEATERAVEQGVKSGIETVVVNLASQRTKADESSLTPTDREKEELQEYKELQRYLRELAKQGAAGSIVFKPDAIEPDTAEDLARELLKIANSALGCTVRLNGQVEPGQECSGELTLNGRERECEGPHGWQLVDPRHIELQGDSCLELNTNPSSILQAAFPCGVFTAD